MAMHDVIRAALDQGSWPPRIFYPEASIATSGAVKVRDELSNQALTVLGTLPGPILILILLIRKLRSKTSHH